MNRTSNRPPSERTIYVEKLNCGERVEDVSFHARKGEILGFAGLMGAGRTETMRALFAADKPDSGEIFLNGKS